MNTEHKFTKQKISAEDGKRKHSNNLKLSEKNDKFSDKDKYSLSKKNKNQKKSAVCSKKHRHETSSSSSSEDSGSDSDVVKKNKRNQSFVLCRNNYSMMVKAIGYILNTNSLNMKNHQIGQLRNV